MGTIYQKIKGAAEAKRRSFVSLGSEDGTVSPTKINQTLVEGSKGMGKKFVDHSNAVMDGFNSTINEAGASFGNNIITDFKNKFKADSGGDSGKDGSVKTAAEKKKEADALAAAGGVEDINAVLTNLGFPGGVKSPAKNAKDEAAEGLKGKKTRRKNPDGTDAEYDYEGVASTVDDVVNITKGEDVVGDYSKEWDKEAAGGLDYADWIKVEGNKAKEDKFVESKTTPGEDKEVKSVEINPIDEKKEETTETPGTKKTYNMGWMETRNTARAIRRKAMSDRNTTRRNERIIKRFENSGGTSDSERMAPEVRGAYEHFSNPDKRTKFDSPISTHTGRDRAATSETVVKEGPKSGEGKTKINSEGVETPAGYKSAAQTLTSGAKYKMKGSSLKRQ
jgi:hypothetical protein